MSTIIEIESKAMLDEYNYNKLTKGLTIYKQENYYIDDESISHHKFFGLRIRIKNNKYELTLKLNNGDSKIEINQDIKNEDFIKLKENKIFPQGEVKNHLETIGINVKTLKIFGLLITYRTDIKYKTSLISIDKNLYLGHVDYEIECEDMDIKTSVENLKEFLNKNMINYSPNHVSKLERVIKAIG